jgi:hypothetical protein
MLPLESLKKVAINNEPQLTDTSVSCSEKCFTDVPVIKTETLDTQFQSISTQTTIPKLSA